MRLPDVLSRTAGFRIRGAWQPDDAGGIVYCAHPIGWGRIAASGERRRG